MTVQKGDSRAKLDNLLRAPIFNRMVKPDLSVTFAALADPTRRSLLERLSRGEEESISELASPFRMSVVAVWKHVRVLERAGLAVIRREGRTRRCRLGPGPLRDVGAWVERYRRFWDDELNQIARYLEASTAESDSWKSAGNQPSGSHARSTRARSRSSTHSRIRRS